MSRYKDIREEEVLSIAAVNAELEKIAETQATHLSREGDSPNDMNTDLDMNSNRIFNLPKPISDHEPARKVDLQDLRGEQGEAGPPGPPGPMPDITPLEDALEAANQRIDTAEQTIADAEQTIADAEERLALAEGKITDAEQQILDAQDRIDDAQDRLDAAEGRISDTEDNLAAAQQRIDDAEQEIADAEQRIANAEQRISDAEQVISDAELDIATIFDSLDDIDVKFVQVDTDLARQLSSINKLEVNADVEALSREEADISLLRSVTQQAASRQELIRRVREGERLVDAVVTVDKNTGQIVNRAFSFTEDKFNEAALEIDGVKGSINLLVQEIALTEDEINNLQSQINLIPGIITSTASSIVAEAISALQPVYAFNFFDSTQGWEAVNGTITSLPNRIEVELGDIENTDLDYDVIENPIIRISIDRLEGDGWEGDVILTFDNNSSQTYTGILQDPGPGGVIRADFRQFSSFPGNVTGVRLILGEDSSDEFSISSIQIGKPDASAESLDNITARVVDVEQELNAIEGTLTGKVDVTTYNDPNTGAVTRSNVESVLDGVNSYAQLRAQYQEIIDEETISKANDALIQVNALDGTVTSLSNSLTQDIEDLESDTNVQFNSVQTQLNSQTGTLTNQALSINRLFSFDEEGKLAVLQAEIDNALFRRSSLKEGSLFASAINELEAFTSPTGAFGQFSQEITAAVGTVEGQVTATNTRVEQAEIKLEEVEGEIQVVADSVTALDARVEGNENFASAQIQLNSSYNQQLETLTARAFIGTDVNNRVTGIVIDDDGVNRTIEFAAESFVFLDGNNEPVVFFDTTNSKYIFDGNLQAAGGTFGGSLVGVDGVFTGSLQAAEGTFVGELVAATGTFAGNLSAASGTFTGDLVASQGTFAGELVAAAGTFTGDLQAAGGTFAGTLTAVNGEFTGDLVSASGTFTGDLVASGGTFTGTLVAADGVFTGTLTAVDGEFTGELVASTGTFTGDLVASGGTFAGELVAVDGTFTGELVAATGTFTGQLTAADMVGGTITIGNNFSVDSNGNVFANSIELVNGVIDNPDVKGGKIVGSSFQAIGDETLEVISGDEFGPDNLVNWFGPRNSTTFNSSTGEANLSNLTRNNSITWKDKDGNVSSNTVGGRVVGQLTATSNADGTNVGTTRSFTIRSNQGFVDITGVTGYISITSGLTGSGNINAVSMDFRIRNMNTNEVVARRRIPMSYNQSTSSAFSQENNVSFFGEDDLTGTDYGEEVTYRIEMEPVISGTGSITGSWFTSSTFVDTHPKAKALQNKITF